MVKRSLGKIYVTGADGFIGSHLVDALVSLGHEVTALCVYNSQGTHGWLEAFAAKSPKNLKLVLGDIRDSFLLESTIAGHDTVFHLASLISIPYSYVASQSYFETNVLGTLNVAEACRKANVGRLIHTSTSEVYGTAKKVPIDEHHPLQGQSPYSASKIGADMVIESYFRSFGLPAITLRPFNTYGPRQSLRAVIPTIITQILAGKKLLSLGKLSPTRDFNYVQDTASAFIALAEKNDNQILGEAFNAGSGREISIMDVALLAAKILDKKITFATDESRIRPKNSEVERLVCDSSKLTAATGWRSRVQLEDGLLRVAEWITGSSYLGRADQYFK